LERARGILENYRAYSDLTPTQYSAALDWLQSESLVNSVELGSHADPTFIVFSQAIYNALWFQDADVLIDTPDDLPEDATRAATALNISFEAAHAQIRSAWGKFDARRRTEVGDAGEQELVSRLQSLDGAEVDHVSRISDGFGYDIHVELKTVTRHLEVKSTTRKSRTTLYISRNEFEVSQTDPVWSLVLVRLNEALRFESVYTVEKDWLKGVVPIDRNTISAWQATKLEVPAERLVPGITGFPDLQH
jgi:hypothetical protein